MEFEKEWKELNQLIEKDKKMKEFMKLKEKEKTESEEVNIDEGRQRKTGGWNVTKDKGQTYVSAERVQSYEEAFNKI